MNNYKKTSRIRLFIAAVATAFVATAFVATASVLFLSISGNVNINKPVVDTIKKCGEYVVCFPACKDYSTEYNTRKDSNSSKAYNSDSVKKNNSLHQLDVTNKNENSGVVGTEKKKIWVVDKPAWSEVVEIPIYSSKPTWFIWFDDGTQKIYYSKEEWIYDCKNAPGVCQWGNGKNETYISGYEEENINHPEEGHWEYQ